MPHDTELITCIYCKQHLPPSREHVVARSLGGDAVRPITCVNCNRTVLSPLDQAIAERSLVAWSRVAETPSDAFNTRLGGEHFVYDAARDMHLEVNLVNGLRPEPFPQIHLRYGNDEAMVVATDKSAVQALVTYIDGRIAASAFRTVHVKHGPADHCNTARIVMHRTKDAFVRLRELGDEQWFFQTLEQAWPTLRDQMLVGPFTAESNQKPTVEVAVAVRPDDVFRAIAKTALNVLALRLGAELALGHEFDALREYVLGTNIRHPPRLGPGEVAVDGRFVQMVPFGETPLVPSDEHAITLFYHEGQMLAYVTLYKVHSFVVTMGAISLPEAVLVTHEFSTVRHGNRALDFEAVYDRLVRREQS